MGEAWRLLRDTVSDWYQHRAQRLGRSAPEFQLVIMPLSVLPTIAPSEDSTIEAAKASAASARRSSMTWAPAAPLLPPFP